MAFPLTGTGRSNNGVVIAQAQPTVAITATPTWSPIPKFIPQPAGLVKVALDTPTVKFTGQRTWVTTSGSGSSAAAWPTYGQGWPRIKQS
jgi:hypothetical protein